MHSRSVCLQHAARTERSGLSPDIAYLAILLRAFLAWFGIKGQAYFRNTVSQPPTPASLILAAMFGNTGYFGFPITLAMLGKEYLAWALFYDLLGSFPGTYALGVLLAASFDFGFMECDAYQLKFYRMLPIIWQSL